MNKCKPYKSILQYILVSGLTKKIEQGFLSRDGDGVEYGARISSFLPFLALPHEWRHSRPDQVPEMGVGRNFNDKLAEIHGHAQDARCDLSAHTLGLGDGLLEHVNQDFPHFFTILGQSPFCEGPGGRAVSNETEGAGMSRGTLPAAILIRLATSAKPTGNSSDALVASNATKSSIGHSASTISFTISVFIRFVYLIPYRAMNHGTT